jgi:hypothetical protein
VGLVSGWFLWSFLVGFGLFLLLLSAVLGCGLFFVYISLVFSGLMVDFRLFFRPSQSAETTISKGVIKKREKGWKEGANTYK